MNQKIKMLKQLLPGFESRKEAFQRQAEMIRALKGGGQEGSNLVDQLTRCADGEPCNLSMCPICVRQLRKSIVLGARMCINNLGSAHSLRLPITAFSAISVKDQQLPGTLAQLDLPLINRRIQRQHQRAGFPLVFAGVDFSLNEYSPPTKPSFWQAQVYGVVVGMGVDTVKAALKRFYPHASSIPRPLRVRECTELPEALSYTIKPGFVRRVSHIDNATGRQNTDNYDLKAAQLRELALCLGRYRLPARYALTGCRRYDDRIDPNPGVGKRLQLLATGRNQL